MRILSIQGENIASLERFEVDFRREPLRSAGLFAITGPTGSGKSSLLDAMCLALFQRAPRFDGVAGQEAKISGSFGELPQENVRNLLRRGASAGWAACEFTARDGNAYRARWGYRPSKRKGMASQEELSLERLDDRQVLVSGNNRKGEFAVAIEGLLGLKYEEFTRTVLLAQGRFAEFLRAPDRDRADLLETLTGTGIYAGISREVYRRASEAESAVRDLAARMSGIEILPDPERILLEERSTALVAIRAGAREALERLDGLVRDLDNLRRLRERESEVSLRHARGQADLLEQESRLAEAFEAFSTARALREAAEPRLRDAERLDHELEHLATQSRLVGEEHDRTRAVRETEARTLDQLDRRGDDEARDLEADQAWLSARERLGPIADDWGLVREQLRRIASSRDMSREQEDRIRLAEEECQTLLGVSARLGESVDSCLRELGGMDPAGIPGELRGLLEERQDLSRRRNILTTRRELGERTDELAQVLGERLEIEARLPQLRAGRDAAREMVESTRLAASANVIHLRAALKPDEPCPVCGSKDHPSSSIGAPVLLELLSTQEAQMVLRESRCAEADSRRTVLVERESVARTRIRDLESTLVELGPHTGSEDPSSTTDPDGLDEIERGFEGVNRRESELARLQLVATRLSGFLVDQRELASRQEATRSRLADSSSRLIEIRGEIEASSEDLDRRFGSPAWRERFESGPSSYVETLDRQIVEWRTTVERRERRTVQMREIALRREALVVSLTERDRALGELSGRIASLEEARTRVSEARAGIHGGRPSRIVRAELDAVLNEAQTRHEGRRSSLEASRLTESADRRELETLALEIGSLRDGVRQRAPETAVRHGFEWAAPDVPEENHFEAVRGARNEASFVFESLGDEAATLNARLQADAESRERRDEASRELEERRSLADRWGRLSAEIGSANGSRFRVIAQGFTLERLLDRAQTELECLSPRYSLTRLGETMSFAVVDHEAWEEVRPVHTLSGGETFLVSLALALALSGLSGSAVTVGTLFIDEGFGTLDPQTLRQVIGALSNLQAQGRQVGLITHVEELKELIPVHVQVAPSTSGASTVSVR